MADTESPTIGTIRKVSGIAGQVSYSVPVTYTGEPTYTATFIGYPKYGGPVIAVMPYSGAQVFVTDPARFGEFGPDWVRRFFGQEA